uniref:Uncharacterized protein n=1 Tax=Arundo donax TaxID=35708 RepID=A0A0A9C500_ARUDO
MQMLYLWSKILQTNI